MYSRANLCQKTSAVISKICSGAALHHPEAGGTASGKSGRPSSTIPPKLASQTPRQLQHGVGSPSTQPQRELDRGEKEKEHDERRICETRRGNLGSVFQVLRTPSALVTIGRKGLRLEAGAVLTREVPFSMPTCPAARHPLFHQTEDP